MSATTELVGQKQALWVGQRLRRKEDARLVTGRGTYVDDVKPQGAAYAAILRSPYAHARIKRIDVSAAEVLRGVLTVLVGSEVREMTDPFSLTARVPVKFYCMATDKVRYVGEPVAAVAADSQGVAEDALGLIDVEYELLPPVMDPDFPSHESVPLHEGVEGNVVWHDIFRYGNVDEAFARADRIVNATLSFPRYAPVPMETFGCIAAFERATNSVTITYNGQIPNVDRIAISGALRLPPENVRLIVPDVGGAFGGKCVVYPYAVLTSLLSKKAGRTVKWIESRYEHLTAGAQASGRKFNVRMALRSSGRILGLDVGIVDDIGAYPKPPEPVGVLRPFETFTGCYKIENLSIDVKVVMTNRCPSAPYRGFGCQHNYFMLERMMDIAARELGVDRARIRFENFIEPDEFPHTTPIGCVYDSGRYPLLLRTALEKIGYEDLKRPQRQRRKDDPLIGVGLATIVEPGGSNFSLSQLYNPDLSAVSIGEAATIRIEPSGGISVLIGTTPQGQGVETVAAQIVADELGVSPAEVHVHPGFDSVIHPSTYTSGTFSSKFASVGVGAVALAARQLKTNLIEVAARMAGANPSETEFNAGGVDYPGKKAQPLAISQIVRAASADPVWSKLLEVTKVYIFPGLGAPDSSRRGNFSATYASSAHAVVVEVDPAVGSIKLLRYVVVHDCGRAINPMIVEAQVQGGVVQGIGGALSEECYYDQDGQMLTSSLMDYALPASTDTIRMETASIETPSPFTVLGTKGAGEGGAMASPAAIANAVEDALWSLGVRVRELPLTPDRVWQKIRASSPSPSKS